jgi:hypothetical protein
MCFQSLFHSISREAAASGSPGCQPRESDATWLAFPSIAAPSPEGAMSGRLMRAGPVSPLRGSEVVVDHAVLGADAPSYPITPLQG